MSRGSSLIMALESDVKNFKKLVKAFILMEKLRRNGTTTLWAECWNCHQKFPEGLFPSTWFPDGKCPYCTARELTKE